MFSTSLNGGGATLIEFEGRAGRSHDLSSLRIHLEVILTSQGEGDETNAAAGPQAWRPPPPSQNLPLRPRPVLFDSSTRGERCSSNVSTVSSPVLCLFHRSSMTSATGWYKISLTFSPTMPTLNDELCLKRRKYSF